LTVIKGNSDPAGERSENASGPGGHGEFGSFIRPAAKILKMLAAFLFPQSAGRGEVEFGGTGDGVVSI